MFDFLKKRNLAIVKLKSEELLNKNQDAKNELMLRINELIDKNIQEGGNLTSYDRYDRNCWNTIQNQINDVISQEANVIAKAMVEGLAAEISEKYDKEYFLKTLDASVKDNMHQRVRNFMNIEDPKRINKY